MTERPILFSAPMVRALLDGRKTQMRRAVTQQNSTVLGERWGRSSPWSGLDFPRARPRDQSTIMRYVVGAAAPRDVHLDVPFLHPTDAAAAMEWDGCMYRVRPQWEAGDLLWVREQFSGPYYCHGEPPRDWGDDTEIWYWADGNPADGDWTRPKPSIHMPRWASRITLRITDVRVERLNEISEADAIAEGLYKSYPDDEDREWFRFHREDEGHTPAPEEWAQFEEGVWMVPGVPQGWGMTPAERRRDQWAPNPQFAYRLIWEHINGPGSSDANPWVWAVSFERVEQAQRSAA